MVLVTVVPGAGRTGEVTTFSPRWTNSPVPVLQANVRYLCYGKEICPTTGTPHLQGYVYYVNPVRNPHHYFSTFGPHVHVERAVGTAEENEEYCSKGGDFTEYGVLPAPAKTKGEAEKKRWEDAFLAAKEGRTGGTRFYFTYQKIKWDHDPPAGHLDGPMQHVWIVGESGPPRNNCTCTCTCTRSGADTRSPKNL